jgi:hypothetical protein
MRSGLNGLSADELVEAGIKHLFLGEPLPTQASGMGFFADPGIDADDLKQAFDLPNEYVEAITRLIVTEGLIGSGNASRVVNISVGPRDGDTRRVALEWVDPHTYTNVEPSGRRVEGDWRRA